MKTCKKLLAVLLCILMALSCAAITASAEDVVETPVTIRISDCKAIKADPNDPETILQLQMSVAGNDDVQFDTVDTSAQIPVFEGLYVEAFGFIMQLSGSDLNDPTLEDEVKNDAKIAVLKPVSIEEGVLTLDVFSKDGSAGAKMISFAVPSVPVELVKNGVNIFIFEFPQGALKDSASGKISAQTYGGSMVEGLASRELKLPSLVEKLVNAVLNNDFGTLISLIPITLFLLPILISTLTNRVQKLYNVYGINIRPLIRTAFKVLRRALPQLLSIIF